jgi:hypothetical protein
MAQASMRFTWRTLAALTVLALIASFGAVPDSLDEIRAIEAVPPEWPDGVIAALVIVDKLVTAELGIVIGLLLSKRTGLARSALLGENPPLAPSRGRLVPIIAEAAAIGIGLGLANLAVAWLLLVQLQLVPEAAVTVDQGWIWWKMVLVSVSAGVNEELVFRLGAMTLFAWLVACLTGRNPAGPAAAWTGGLLAAFLFAASHFTNVSELTLGIASAMIVGNVSNGLVFGWLYWQRGLESAIVAHGSLDVVLKVLGPALGIWI